MKKDKKLKHKNKRSTKQKWLIRTGVFVGIYFISLFVPLISPYTKFPLYVIKCGGLPVVEIGYSYILPTVDNIGRRYYINPLIGVYYCTEQEAKDAGLRKSPPDGYVPQAR